MFPINETRQINITLMNILIFLSIIINSVHAGKISKVTEIKFDKHSSDCIVNKFSIS